jgi:hypothetical protein
MANSAILATVKNCYEEEETPVGIYFDWGFLFILVLFAKFGR